MRSELLTGELLKSTFRIYWCVLKNFFEQLRAMADSLLLTKDPLVVPYGSLFYTEMFLHFEEYYQQEVVEALIQHICCAGIYSYNYSIYCDGKFNILIES